MIDNDKAYLGTGWGFPPTFEKASKYVNLVSAEQDICESLAILLSTSLGERVMQPTYGCNLNEFLFETLSPTVIGNIKELIATAILYHEPRIRLDEVDINLENQWQGIVEISVDYTIPNTNSRFNFVYPFYVQEGSGALIPSQPKQQPLPDRRG